MACIPVRRPCTGRLVVLLILLLLVPLAERWRGQRALRGWKEKMIAKGELFDDRQLWPTGPTNSAEFARRLDDAAALLPSALMEYAGVSGIVDPEGSRARRGSQEPRPQLSSPGKAQSSWADLDQATRRGNTALVLIRELMRNPPSAGVRDVAQLLETETLPNFVSVRICAQALHAAALDQLHAGDLPGAVDNLTALISFGQLYADDPTLVSYMLRMAAIGLSADVCWDALQASNWNDQQLSRLQRACHDVDHLLSQMPRTMEFERAGRIHQLNRFRCESYDGWLARYQPIFRSFGSGLPACDSTPAVRLWRQWIFHPLWCLAWADQEELEFLRHSQSELAVLRDPNGSWLRLKRSLTALRESYQPPPCAWRFYRGLPLVDHFSDVVGGSPLAATGYPYPDFSRAWLVSMKNLTLHQLVITAIAIQRYALRYGEPPPNLGAVVPMYLAKLPRDLMDGKLLRYRRTTDNSFLLYSIGEDCQDQGGNSEANPAASNNLRSPWNGTDWVWPQDVSRPVSAAKSASM